MTDSHYTSQRVWDSELGQFLDPVAVMTSVLSFFAPEEPSTSCTEAAPTAAPVAQDAPAPAAAPLCEDACRDREVSDATTWEFLAQDEEEQWDDYEELGVFELDVLDEDPGTAPLYLEVTSSGMMARDRLLTRFLDARLAGWGLDGSVVAHFMDMLWSSGNHHATWRALERGLDRGLTVDELYWVHEVREACREQLELYLGWAPLFDSAQRFERSTSPEEFAALVALCHDLFEEDLARTRRWHSKALEWVEREEGHGYFGMFLESMLSKLSGDMDPCHKLEAVSAMALDAPGRRFEHEARRPDHFALDPGSHTFSRLLSRSASR